MRNSISGDPRQVTKEVSSKIVNMSLWGALLVISIHCGFSTSEGGVCWLVHQVFSGGYSRIAVPFFFLVSGYFLAAHISDKGWWKMETLKRVRTILAPFFIWAFLYQLLFIPLSICADIIANRPFGTNICIFNGNALNVFGFEWDKWPTSVPLWYLRALFMFVVVSPLVVWMLRKATKIWFLSLFIGTIMLNYMPDPDLGGWSGFCNHVFKISGLMYFSFGMYLRINDIHFKSKKVAILGAIAGSLLLIVQGVSEYYVVALKLPYLDFAIPCLMYATWYFMPARSIPDWLKGVSFPTYLAHSLFLGYWGIFSKNVGVDESIAKLISWPMAFVGCIILANLIRRMAPRAFAILFGGR